MLKDIFSQYRGNISGHTELRAQKNSSRVVGVLGGNLVVNTSAEQSGVCARVYKNGVYGFAAAAEQTPGRVAEILKAAEENAAFMDRRAAKGKPPLPVIEPGKRTTAQGENDVQQSRLIDFARELEAWVAAAYPTLASRSVRVRCEAMEKRLVTSDGYESYSLMPRSHIYVTLALEAADGAVVELMERFGGQGWFDEQFTSTEVLREAIDRKVAALHQKAEGVYASAGVRDVVLDSDLAGILAHEAVGHTVEADIVLGGSVAGPMLNRQVASPIVTMVDYAYEVNGQPAPLPVFVDDEGTPAEDAVLIKDGTLVGYMHSRESAQHFGAKPQGNARAWGFNDEPLIRMRNTAILPGTAKLEEMIACIKDGYYLTETSNGQADTTGEFMFGINMGYEIKDGKLGRAIRDTTISGVAFEMLKTVDMLSDDMVWSCAGTCGKKQPMSVGMGGPAVKCKVNIGGR